MRVAGEAAPQRGGQAGAARGHGRVDDRDLGAQPCGEADGVVGGLGEADELESLRVHHGVGEAVELHGVGQGDEDALGRPEERTLHGRRRQRRAHRRQELVRRRALDDVGDSAGGQHQAHGGVVVGAGEGDHGGAG